MRKIYFAAAISAGRDDAMTYSQIISELKPYGEVLTPQFGSSTMGTEGESLPAEMVHDRDLGWIKECDAFVAEVSTPSLGVGYQIGHAAEWGKPILCLYREGRNPLSKMLVGNKEIIYVPYSITPELRGVIKQFFATLDAVEQGHL